MESPNISDLLTVRNRLPHEPHALKLTFVETCRSPVYCFPFLSSPHNSLFHDFSDRATVEL